MGRVCHTVISAERLPSHQSLKPILIVCYGLRHRIRFKQ